MYRWPLILFLVFCGILAVLYPKTMARSAAMRPDYGPTRDRERARFIAVAEALDLSWAADSEDGTSGRKLMLSDFPVTFKRHSLLSINGPHFERWRGTIAVYYGAPKMWSANHDPDHPDRAAVLGNSFVYGDPELIERVRAAIR